jgi:hypothetical protein
MLKFEHLPWKIKYSSEKKVNFLSFTKKKIHGNLFLFNYVALIHI